MSAAAELAAQLAGTARPGDATVIVAVEGRSGAGKTSFGASLAEELGAAHVDMENLYPGWWGLGEGARLAATELVAPIAAGETAVVPQWDWIASRPAEPLVLDPPDFLVLSGTGSGSLAAAPHLALLAWMELGDEERRRRALARDGEVLAGQWDDWAGQELAYLESDKPRERADVVVDTSGAAPVIAG
ncbi:MAG: hypothetical protein FGM34_07585 [Solirubrobacteraceae bacterium]|nr:hypothetical protein [Solirubrobacteraceae bacterium]